MKQFHGTAFSIDGIMSASKKFQASEVLEFVCYVLGMFHLTHFKVLGTSSRLPSKMFVLPKYISLSCAYSSSELLIHLSEN